MPDKQIQVAAAAMILALIVASSGCGSPSSPTAKPNASPPAEANKPAPEAAPPAPASEPKVVDAIKMAAINDYAKGRIVVPAIEIAGPGITDGYIGLKDRLPVKDMTTGRLFGYWDEKRKADVDIPERAAEHKVGGKVVATSTHVIEGAESEDGKSYVLFVKAGGINAVAVCPAGQAQQLLFVVADEPREVGKWPNQVRDARRR